MKYLLDTNICIYFFRGKFDLLQKFKNIGIEKFAISEITLAELIFGAENSSMPEKNHNLIENFTKIITILPIYNSIYFYGKEKARLRKIGKPVSDFDLLIGATAIENKLTLITENIKDFSHLKGVKMENWIIK
jgi:tRNA(fMet)-specific endonuclease VapC